LFSHSAQRHRQTDRQTTVSGQQPITLRVLVRSAKNCGSTADCNFS